MRVDFLVRGDSNHDTMIKETLIHKGKENDDETQHERTIGNYTVYNIVVVLSIVRDVRRYCCSFVVVSIQQVAVLYYSSEPIQFHYLFYEQTYK